MNFRRELERGEGKWEGVREERRGQGKMEIEGLGWEN